MEVIVVNLDAHPRRRRMRQFAPFMIGGVVWVLYFVIDPGSPAWLAFAFLIGVVPGVA
jgi:hypothetical protein